MYMKFFNYIQMNKYFLKLFRGKIHFFKTKSNFSF